MLTLIIDTSTERGIVALSIGKEILFVQHLPFGQLSSKHLLSTVQLAFKTLNITPNDLERIGVGVGPGLFTGIRVGVATVKGLAFPRNIPLVGFSSLQGFVSPLEGLFASVIDARIGGIYCLLQKRSGDEVITLGAPKLCNPSDVEGLFVVGPTFGRLSFSNAQEVNPDPKILANVILQSPPSSNLEILYLRNSF